MTLQHLFLASFFVAGCTAEMTDSPVRGPIGKADLLGTCSADDCGGPSADGNCYCDDACVTFGDCCGNQAEVCEVEPTTSCGGFAGLDCGEGSYCHFDLASSCGVATPSGTCLPTPEACIQVVMPVCGCDGQTYGNECEAHAAGASVAKDGACDEPPPPLGGKPCGGFAGLQCEGDLYCAYPADAMCGAADQMGTCSPQPEACIQNFDPVCGCDGQSYSNACMAASVGVSVLHDGDCN